jgi:hypothetical protein
MDNIKKDVMETAYDGVEQIHLAQDRNQCQGFF